MRPHCLGGWVTTIAKKMAAAKYKIDLIHRKGPDRWHDFLQYFSLFAWERIVCFGHNGLSHYDVENAARNYLVGSRRMGAEHEVPSVLVTQHRHSDKGFEADEDSTNTTDDSALIRNAIQEILGEGLQETETLLNELLQQTQTDDVTILFYSDSITLQDAAILWDCSVANATKRLEDERTKLMHLAKGEQW